MQYPELVMHPVNLLYLDNMIADGAFEGKVAFITGSSRGIGRAIALKLATLGARVVITGKTDSPHPDLPGTIHSVAKEITDAGGSALAVQMDVRFEEEVSRAVEKAVSTFGGMDILVNNASAIYLANVESTPMKRFDLMHSVNVRGTYLTSRLCLPHLRASGSGSVLMLAPPPNLDPKWFGNHLAYTISKYGMSMCVLGMAEEFGEYGICVNALWPGTLIATAAVQNLLGGETMIRMSRKPTIVADAAALILADQSPENSGHFYIDEDVLRKIGVDNFRPYAVDPESPLQTDLFLEEDSKKNELD